MSRNNEISESTLGERRACLLFIFPHELNLFTQVMLRSCEIASEIVVEGHNTTSMHCSAIEIDG